MKTKLHLLCSFTFLFILSVAAQVGVGNTNPQAQLDISASSTSSPANDDGILIPRMSNFPSAPGAARDGMLIFYTGTAADGKGFYYWDQTITNWISIKGSEWFDAGTFLYPSEGISEDISIGKTSAPDGKLDILSDKNYGIHIDNRQTGNTNNQSVYNLFNNTANTGQKIGTHSAFWTDTSGKQIGINNTFFNDSAGDRTGVDSQITGHSSGEMIGTFNSINMFTGTGESYGVKNNLGSSRAGDQYAIRNFVGGNSTGNKFGNYTHVIGTSTANYYGTSLFVNGTGTGPKYGVYSEISSTSGGTNNWAGFFIGRVYVGTSLGNGYNLPLTDGSSNQIISTDGSGQLSFVDASALFTNTDDQNLNAATLTGTTLNLSIENGTGTSVNLASLQDGTGTDNQTIDNLSLSGTTLRLSLEDDGQPLQTVNLASLQDGTGTDNQNLLTPNLTGTTLNLGIENGTGTSINLASLQDGTGTDNQTIDNLSLVGTTLRLSLEDDAQPLQTVDLSSLQDGSGGTLDQAYDFGGAGAGNTITADNGAVTINGEDGFLITGTFGSGDAIIATNPLTRARMFYNPRKAAFRAGYVTGTDWDDANVGSYSTAFGSRTRASGYYSTAFGLGANASGVGAMAFGYFPTASGYYSTAFGFNTEAPSYAETTIGTYSTSYTPLSIATFNTNDRLFSIGNGSWSDNRSNALTIYKNGLMNINDEYNMPLTDGTNGQVLTSDGSGNVTFQNVVGDGIGTDNQNIQNLDLNISTNILTVGIENGAAQTVNLSSYLDNTDNQTIDNLSLSGTTLRLSLEDDAQPIQTVNLASLQDGTGTDNQTIDNFSLSGTTLRLSLEDDAQPLQTVNLSPLRDHDWYAANTTNPTTSIDQNIFTNGRVGIFEHNPTANLHIEANSTGSIPHIKVTENNDSDGARITFNNSVQTANSWTFYGRSRDTAADSRFNLFHTTAGNVMVVTGNGDVGIGATPSYRLDVRDNINSDYVAQIFNTSTNANADGLKIRVGRTTSPTASNDFIAFFDGNNTTRGRIQGSGTGITYNTISDRRLKTNIKDVTNALSLIDLIKPRNYEYKASVGINEYGFIAQELQTIYPQAVTGSPSSDVAKDPMMVDYGRLTPILTAGLKELHNKVKILEVENTMLKVKLNKLESLEARLLALENKSNSSSSETAIITKD